MLRQMPPILFGWLEPADLVTCLAPDSVRFSLAPLHSRCAIAHDLTPARLIDFASVPVPRIEFRRSQGKRWPTAARRFQLVTA